MSSTITCSICNKKVPSSQSWSRWNFVFCTRACYQIQAKIEDEKQRQKDEQDALKKTHHYASYSSNAGSCF